MNTNSRQEARASHTRKLSGTRSMATTKTTLTEQEIDTMTWMYRVAGVPQQKLARDYEISRSQVSRLIAQHEKRTKSGK